MLFRSIAVQLRRVQAQAGLAGAELRELQGQLDSGDGTLSALLQDDAWRTTLARIQGSAGQVRAALSTTGQRLGDAMGDSLARAQLIENVNRTSAQLAALQRMMASTDGYIGRSQRDSALARAMHGAQAQLDSLIREAKKKPLRFVF